MSIQEFEILKQDSEHWLIFLSPSEDSELKKLQPLWKGRLFVGIIHSPLSKCPCLQIFGAPMPFNFVLAIMQAVRHERENQIDRN